MKNEIRLLGVDDSPFAFKDKFVPVIGVILRGGTYLEGVIKKQVEIDGNDAAQICIDMIKNTRHRKQLRAILLDGITLGGFNIIDIEKIFTKTKLPVITITRDKPNIKKIENALKKHFSDWKKRLDLIKKCKLHEIKTKHNPIYIGFVGMTLEEAKEIIKISTIRGVIPEPIRVAHLIASGIKRGESYGKA
jgi:endonuclease V-like protein UPF0215 family